MKVIQGKDLDDWMPHRDGMRLIDRLIDVGSEHAVAEVDVPTDGLFVENGQVPAWVGIEYMAQTVAAWAGGRAINNGQPPRLGFLLGSRRFNAYQPNFVCGSTIRIEIRCELIGDNGLGQFDCRIYTSEAKLLAEAKVNVFEPVNDDALRDILPS